MLRPRGEWVVWAAATTLFALMCAPGITWMDDGELAVAAHTLGGAHPPGHPLHTMLGKLATLIPIGEIGFRVALLSAIAMGAALAGVVALARALVASEHVAAYAAAGLAALSPTVQLNATRAEVYAPVAALIVWATVLVIRFVRAPGGAREPERGAAREPERDAAREPERDAGREPERGAAREALTAAVLLGCAAAIHPLIAFAAAVPLAAAVAIAARRRNLRLAPLSIACALVPLLGYLALIVRAHAETPPPFMWGGPGTWSGLVDVIGGASYRGNFALEGAAGRFAELVLLCGEGLALGLLLGGLIGLGFGALSGLRGAGVVLLVACAVIAGAATQGAFNPDMPGYVTPALLLLGAGLAPIVGATLRMLPADFAGPGSRVRPLLAAAVLVPFVGVGLAGGTVRAVDGGFRRGDDPTRRFSSTVERMPPGPAIYFASGDDGLFPAMYERFVAGARPDVILLEPELCRDRWFLEWANRTLPEIRYPFIEGPGVPAPIGRAIAAINAANAAVGGDDWRMSPGVAHPVGRGYGFGPGPEDIAEPPPPYRGDLGGRVAGKIGLVRGMYEQARGRLGTAATAAGLSARFEGQTLEAQPGRWPLAPLIPRTTPAFIFEPWQRALFGDDLAWNAGLPAPDLPPDDARERFIHKSWRMVLEGALEPEQLVGLTAAELATLGTLLERSGRRETARDAYELARRLDPGVPGVADALDRLGR